MHGKVCSPIWNTKNLIYILAKKLKEHYIPFPMISAIFFKTSPQCLQTSAQCFSHAVYDMYNFFKWSSYCSLVLFVKVTELQREAHHEK